MDRSNATLYLEGSLGQFAVGAGLAGASLAFVWMNAVDDALLALSTPVSGLSAGTVADGDVIGYRALLTYFGLVRLHEAVMASVDVTVDGPQMGKRFSQYVETLERRIKLAKSAAEHYATAGPLADANPYADYGAFNTGQRALVPTEMI